MFILMVVIFVVGYTMIALEHPLRIDKAAPALLIGVLTWVVYILGAESILSPDVITESVKENFDYFIAHSEEYISFAKTYAMSHNGAAVPAHEQYIQFIAHHEVLHHLSEIATILFFLLGAMTIVEIVDQHQGFTIITDKIKTTKKSKLLWILSFLTFFMSAALDNLTTTIVLVALIRKLVDDQKTKWFFASMVVLAANAGGAWSPIGDVTTIMLWIGGQVTAGAIVTRVFLPSMMTMLVPLIIATFMMKGDVNRPEINTDGQVIIPQKQKTFILILGVASLLFVPVFKTFTHLPPYLGMLLGLGNLWLVTEVLHRWYNIKRVVTSGGGEAANSSTQLPEKNAFDKLHVVKILSKVDVPTVFFFLGILSAVAALQSAGHLGLLANVLDETFNGNVYLIDMLIGVLSSVVDNVPLVAGAMGMYDIAPAGATGEAAMFVQDGVFWEFLAYTAGTGGSILIIGSAAGVAAMGMEKIDFIWYLKKISLLALAGYLAGAAVYYLEIQIIG